jgi:hypothetical protein
MACIIFSLPSNQLEIFRSSFADRQKVNIKPPMVKPVGDYVSMETFLPAARVWAHQVLSGFCDL